MPAAQRLPELERTAQLTSVALIVPSAVLTSCPPKTRHRILLL